VKRRRYRPITTLICAAAALGIGLAVPGPVALDGPVLDALIRARAAVGRPWSAEPSPVAVIAVDERSLESPELASSPRALFAPVWADLTQGLTAAGVRAIGFDLLFTYSANRLSPDHDRPFLEALAQHRDRVVLARSARSLPAPPFLAALDADDPSLGLAELVADPDGVYRRVPRGYRADTEEVPTLAAALLARAGVAAPPGAVLLTPRQHPEAIPTYGLAAVLRCARESPATLARALSGRLVFVGSTLPDEDRKVSSARFLHPVPEGPPLGPCGLRHLGASNPASAAVPGVYLHALAVDAVVRGELTRTAPGVVIALLTALVAALATLTALNQSPWRTLGLMVLATAALFAIATAALVWRLWLPLALPFAAVLTAPPVGYVVRYLVEERTRRRIEVAFGRYLSPHVVEQLVMSAGALRLGGERRDVSVMFADLSGFTALSGKVSPEELTRLTNEYLAYIVDAVETQGGYVDKFIGDAVMAIWGAPAPDGEHAVRAVRAALASARAIDAARLAGQARGQTGFSVKIGINSGPAVVGNVGTERRYNYTAVGETVNVASRLEGAPGVYDCAIVVGEATASLARDAFLFRELDRVRVKGREAPLTIFEPLAQRAAADDDVIGRQERYEAALEAYRRMRFAEAVVEWSALGDGPAKVMAARARTLGVQPPPRPWDAVWTFTGK
jgi:class 3 adenylate cyclase/CHASE2 domain-containing sensor protein